MNTLVVYFSKFGNTKLIASAIAETLESAGTVRLLGADRLATVDFSQVDLLVMGTPTHKMNLPVALRPLLEALPRRLLKGIPVAAFDTSYKMSWWLSQFTAAKRLARWLRKLGGQRLIAPETFHVTEREGPLYDGEIKRASLWAERILGRLESVTSGA